MKVILFASMSVNGKIARLNDDEDFLSDENWKTFTELAKTCGCFVVGRRAYEIVMKKYKKYNFSDVKAKCFVLTNKNSKNYSSAPSPEDIILKAKQEGFKSLLVTGGSKTNTSFMKSKHVEKIIVNIEPFVLGQGFSIFYEEDFESKLILEKTRKLKYGIIQLHYRVKK